MNEYMFDLTMIAVATVLVLINGFFVAAEFAMVKVRVSKIDDHVQKKSRFAATARGLLHRLDASLSTCQLGITMASLGLGWIGEPAFAHLIRAPLHMLGISSEAVIHGVAFAIAFSIITAAHLVIGEQVPKILAIRRPEKILLWCALPMQLCYYLFYPPMIMLTVITSKLLKKMGVDAVSEHERPHNEKEIRALLNQSRIHGELSRLEHKLLNSVFEFDDMICRRVMIPRSEVVIFDVNKPFSELIELAMRTKHSRYPVCDKTLDHVLGVVHIKDLLGIDVEEEFDIRSVIRSPQFFPELTLISRILQEFRSNRQHMAFIVDEYGSVTGCITLENVLEQIVGPVQDEFDKELPRIVIEGPKQFLIHGGVSLDEVNRALKLNLSNPDVDTLSGLLMAKTGRFLRINDRIELEGGTARVLEVDRGRATHIRFYLDDEPSDLSNPTGENKNP